MLIVEGGAATPELELINETEIPPVGATPLRDTLPWEGFPPITLAGLSVKEAIDGGSTVTVADLPLEL
jgi:hypothetical protein